jgi:hypothetical protein
MTSTEEAVADAAAIPQDLAEAATRALAEQPTFATLLDPGNTVWGGEDGPGRHVVIVAPDVAGVLDAGAGRFIPDDPEQVRLLLADRMAATVGGTPVAGGARDRVIDWTTLQLTDEAGGLLTATANTVADVGEGDAVHAVRLSIDLALQPTVATEELVSGGAFEEALDQAIEVREAQAAEAEAALEAAVAEAAAEVATDAAAPAAEEPGEEPAEPAPAVDAAYLGGYYGESAFPFDGKAFVFDWTSWTHDQTTPDGTVGFTARATATDGSAHDTYAWFDPSAGISIVRAEALAGAGGAAAGEPASANVDPRAEFETVLTEQLRDRWRSVGNRLEELNGKTYDVHGWVDGEPGCELVHQSFDGENHLAELGAHTADDGRAVTVLLRIRDAETVWVDREDDRY